MAPSIFDPAELLDLIGGDRALLRELVDIAIEQINGQAAAFEVMLEDRAGLTRSAHVLRGVLLNLRAEEAAEIARRIESNAGSPEIKAEIDALDVALTRLGNALLEFQRNA